MSERAAIYCLVPASLEDVLLGSLQRHYAHDPRVRVMVDRRAGDRRGGEERSPEPPLGPRGAERRTGTDRRRPALPRRIAAFPPELERHRGDVRFVQRLVPVSSALEALSADEVVDRVRAGDPEAPTELYWRCYERMHSRLSVLLGDPARADAALGAAFGRLLDVLDRRGPDAAIADFDALLYEAVDASVPPPATADEPTIDLEFEPPSEPSLAITDPLLDEPVSVLDRDPRWFVRARGEREAILRAAGLHVVAIEHVGGTALPALPGRPVIDLLVGVDTLPVPDELHAVLLERGFEDCGDAGTPGRAYYRQRAVMHFDVHVVEHGGELWRSAIAVRDHLLADRPLAIRWATARREAAKANGTLLRYAEARRPALAEVLESLPPDTETPD